MRRLRCAALRPSAVRFAIVAETGESQSITVEAEADVAYSPDVADDMARRCLDVWRQVTAGDPE